MVGGIMGRGWREARGKYAAFADGISPRAPGMHKIEITISVRGDLVGVYVDLSMRN
jgi:hypothetical protein